MADVRINSKRYNELKDAKNLGNLLDRLAELAPLQNSEVTRIFLNKELLNFEDPRIFSIKLTSEDTVDIKLETVQEMALECLQVAQDMAELLIFDIKVATVHLWDDCSIKNKSLETLLEDCNKFLRLASQPLKLLDAAPTDLSSFGQDCLRQLDLVANTVEDATLLSVTGRQRDACVLLVAKVIGAIESWLGFSVAFAEELNLTNLPKDHSALQNAFLP